MHRATKGDVFTMITVLSELESMKEQQKIFWFLISRKGT